MSETVIGKNLTIDGEVTGDDALSIHGVVRGAISVSEAVYVSADSGVEATIDSLDVEIAGGVEGNVAASEKIEIKSGGYRWSRPSPQGAHRGWCIVQGQHQHAGLG